MGAVNLILAVMKPTLKFQTKPQRIKRVMLLKIGR